MGLQPEQPTDLAVGNPHSSLHVTSELGRKIRTQDDHVLFVTEPGIFEVFPQCVHLLVHSERRNGLVRGSDVWPGGHAASEGSHLLEVLVLHVPVQEQVGQDFTGLLLQHLVLMFLELRPVEPLTLLSDLFFPFVPAVGSKHEPQNTALSIGWSEVHKFIHRKLMRK